MLSGSPVPTLLLDVSRDDWRVSWLNPAALRLLRCPPGDVNGQPARPLLRRLGGSGALDAVSGVGRDQPQGDFSSVIVNGDGQDEQLRGRIVMPDDNPDLRIVYVERAVAVESPAGTTASFANLPSDSVTVFLRRDPWLALLRRDAAIAAREQAWVAVIVFRIDALGSYVETFGQHAGDSALKRIAHSVRRRLQRAGDTASRVADDELAILVHGTSAPSARQFAMDIAADVQALAIHHPRSPHGRHLSLSVGLCARVPRGEEDAESMFQQARAQIDQPDSVVPLFGERESDCG